PAANGDGVDVEIIDFKTNRFSPPKGTSRTVRTATANVSTGSSAGQGSFDFDAVVEQSSAEILPTVTASLDEQAERFARDYRLQMQAYALALRELLPADVHVRTLRATLHFLDPNREISLADELLDRASSARAIDDAMQTI